MRRAARNAGDSACAALSGKPGPKLAEVLTDVRLLAAVARAAGDDIDARMVPEGTVTLPAVWPVLWLLLLLLPPPRPPAGGDSSTSSN